MRVEELPVPGAWLVTPEVHEDVRGGFAEWYRHDRLREAAGRELPLAQASLSTSSRGVLRGVHYADVPPGQPKLVTCVRGAVHDVVVDLRTSSPTFGRWHAVRLDDRGHRALYLAEGLGHAFCALEDASTVVYLTGTVHDPAREHGVHPLDPELAIDWPRDAPFVLSEKDSRAPTLAAAREAGLLPG